MVVDYLAFVYILYKSINRKVFLSFFVTVITWAGQISLPFHILKLVKPVLFHIPEA